MTTLGLGSFSAPEAPSSTGVTEGLFLHSYSPVSPGRTDERVSRGMGQQQDCRVLASRALSISAIRNRSFATSRFSG